MVAYTAEFCLPYFEGSDSPCVDTGEICAPSTVWCEMAAKINDALVAFDVEIDRAVASFPYAQVAVSEVPFTFSSGVSNSAEMVVTWDTVVGDSDGMVNLGVDPTTVNLRRSGIWNLSCIAVMRNTIDNSNLRVQLVHPGIPGITVFSSAVERTWVDPVPSPGVDFLGSVLGLSVAMDMFCEVDASAGGVPLQIELEVFAGVGDHIVTVEVCRFSARWVADLP